MTRPRLPLLILLLTLIISAALVACGDDDEDVNGESSGDETAPAGATVPPTVEPAPATPADCPEPTGTAPEVQMKSYPSAPAMTIDTSKTYTATIKTVRGDIVINLRPDLAPQHVNSFVFLAREGFYDGVTFHRVLPGFVAQAGDPTGTGSGGPGYTLPAEFSDPSVAKFERGTLGMARAGSPDSGGSQWFINYAATPSLDGQYTIFGEVTAGMEVVDCITPRDPSSNPNAPAGDAIVTIEIAES
jgi:peptidylprolyl isomerase